MNAAAIKQWGNAWSASCREHLWSWFAQKYNLMSQEPIDILRAAKEQYNDSSMLAVSTGVHAYDWKAFNPFSANYCVLPVIQIPSDRWLDIQGVKKAVTCFESALESSKYWLQQQVGKQLDILAPLVIRSNDMTAAKWDELCNRSLVPADQPGRYDYLNTAINIMCAGFNNKINGNIQYLVTQWGIDNGAGAANRGNISVIPPRATNYLHALPVEPLPDITRDILYAICHELLHGLGLDHPEKLPEAQRPTGWQESIMQWGWHNLPHAQLTAPEKQALQLSPYFK